MSRTLIVLSFFIIQFVIYLSTKNSPSSENTSQLTKEQQTITDVKELEFTPQQILWKFDVFFDSSNQLRVENLIPYCTNHNHKLKMAENIIGFKCPICINAIATRPTTLSVSDFTRCQKLIESQLENRLEQLYEN